MPSHFGSYISSHNKWLMNDVFKPEGGFYKKIIYYTDPNSLYIHEKQWFDMVDNGFAGKSRGLNNNEYGNLGTLYAWFLAPKIKYCVMIDDSVVISAEKTLKSYNEEQRMIERNEFISL